MKLRSYLTLTFLFISVICAAQNMQEGFKLLEAGNFKAAVPFFETILKDHPNNKTAILCYGRAVGLSGAPDKATSLYKDLLSKYPDDFEVKLNYAESLLWDKKFDDAKDYYETILKEDDKSFTALLGYANTLSNLKQYKEALTFVNKALDITPGNLGALTSKKYIYLGYAYKNQQQQHYREAETLLKENLALFENDKATLTNMANLYLITQEFDKATDVYNTLSQDKSNKTMSLNGLALVSHLKHKEKTALKLSTQAYETIPVLKDTTLVNRTQERYIQALIWNKKFKGAEILIDELNRKSPNQNWILALRATLNIYKSNFKKSLKDYDRILVNDSASFDGNLGKANTLKALGLYKGAYQSANNTLLFYKKQKDAAQFIKDLDWSFTPFLEAKGSYSFDNGNNEAYSYHANVEFPISMKFRWLLNYGYRTTSNSVTNNKATSNTAALGFAYHLLPNITFKGTVGMTSAKAETDDYTQVLTDFSFHIKPAKLQILDIGFKREIQSFNADLLDREIIMSHLYANYNISTNFNLGWFTQYFYTMQNDNNSRHLLFTSLYYNIMAKPALKAGLNYQYITFENQVPAIYFSPGMFNAAEVFVNVIKSEQITKPKAWFYELTVATGFQFIEKDPKQSTYRAQGKLGYMFSERALLNIYGTRSNIASATAAGFTFTEIGLRLKWYIDKTPNFKK